MNLKESHPHLIKEWHEDNGPMELFTYGSNKKVTWICANNHCGCHIWITSINSRTRKDKLCGCPFCSNQKVCVHNNLKVVYPELIKNWHPDNKPMESYSQRSGAVVKWICPVDPCGCHIWTTAISHRTHKNPTGCPFCSNQKVCAHNNLMITNPELIGEWHPENKPMNTYTCSSAYKVKWICSKNKSCECHLWTTSISHRTGKNASGCPFCCNQKVCAHNNLKVVHPELIKNWHPDNKPMESYSPRSGAVVKWICSNVNCGCHEWNASIHNKTQGKNVEHCPFCLNKKLCKHNNLKSLFPDLISEWSIENKAMDTYVPGTDAKVKWKCKNDHIWTTAVRSRTKRQATCPKCKACPSCQLWDTGGVLCEYCIPLSENKLYHKTKEMTIVNFLKEQLPNESFIHNKSVGSSCTNGHLFPDVLFECFYFNLIVEIDEFKHRGSNYACDQQRMYDIIAKTGIPCIFIRYNPDSKQSNKHILLDLVVKYLQLRDDETYQNNGVYDWDDFGYKCEYLFY